MVGISCDSPIENRVFRDKFSFTFDLLCDPTKTMARAYGVLGLDDAYPARVTYLIDPWSQIHNVYINIDPPTHAQTVLRDLP